MDIDIKCTVLQGNKKLHIALFFVILISKNVNNLMQKMKISFHKLCNIYIYYRFEDLMKRMERPELKSIYKLI